MKQKAFKASITLAGLRLEAAGLGLAGLLLCGTAAEAGLVPVAPGQTALVAGTAYQTPVGSVVASESVPFVATYQPNGSFVNFAGFATGEFNDQVLRDPKTGHLTFVYNIQLNNEGITSASQGSELTVNGFGPYTTDVAGQLQFEPMAPVERSANGSSLRFYANSAGLGGAPELAVKTNATRFDSRGTVSFSLADVFLVSGPRGQELDDVWGNVSFKNAFRPTGAPSTGGSTVVAVPLPPAFYTGVGIMMACGIISLFRRLMGN